MPESDFQRNGYVGPIRVFTAAECLTIGQYLRQKGRPAPSGWTKAQAVHERFLYDLATRPAILDRVAGILGDDVVLWGVTDVRRRPGQVHPWHSDIESSGPEGGFVSVWIGIENTNRDSSLQIISRSHRCRTVQEARAAVGLKRDDATPEVLVRLARDVEPAAELVVSDVGNGEAIFFDGRLWHGTDNRNREGERLALLLQYAVSSREIRIPDFQQLDWPFRFLAHPLPPVILVRGTDGASGNRVVPPPPPPSGGTAMVETAIHKFPLPLGEGEPTKPWEPFPAFRGPTRCLTDMSCHASVLVGGHVPHPPHQHIEEEILIVLHGEVELTIPSGPSDPAPRLELLRPGSFVYYPGWQWHTIRNPGTAPVGYLMFKWKAPPRDSDGQLGTQVIRLEDTSPPEGAPPVWQRRLMEGPTGCLGKLHSHVTVLAPGAGYEPHRDAYDVAIIPLDGTVETLGQAVSKKSVIYYGAGELHGMRNQGSEPARYLVFEFHAPGVDPMRGPPPDRPLHLQVASALVRGGKRLARPVWRRVKRFLPKRG